MSNETEEQLRARVAAAMPTLSIHTTRLIDEGWDSLVLIVNDQWLFRFPRRAEVAAQLVVEQALLPTLADRLPIALPRFELQVPAGDALPFVGYRLLPGVQMRPPLIAALSVEQQDALAAQLGTFLSALHSFPVEEARALAPTIRTTERQPITAEYAAIQRDVFPRLTPTEQQWARALYAAASEPGVWKWSPAIVHNDLTSDHILFDPHTQRISGIIDWGDMEVGDPANDFTGLLEYGQPFVEAALRHYTLPVDQAFRTRVVSLLPRTLLSNLQHYAIHFGDEVGIERMLWELRERTTLRELGNWQPLIESLDQFSDDFIRERDQPPQQSRETLFD